MKFILENNNGFFSISRFTRNLNDCQNICSAVNPKIEIADGLNDSMISSPLRKMRVSRDA
jgi:hypothetical protein